MGVWKQSCYSAAIAASHKGLRSEMLDYLEDLQPEDIVASPYAVADYTVSEALGGKAGLLAFRERLKNMNIKLMLDFVPNHMALDNRWLPEHPELFVSMSADDPEAACFEFTKGQFLAHGKDPYFAPWSDTLQLNYANPATQEMMIKNLLRISELCEGVRCDMAMLLIKEVFDSTWENRCEPMHEEFWPKAITRVKEARPDFIFLAEAYWHKEWALQQMGFDFTYDKLLYDHLGSVPVNVADLREHLLADAEYQNHLCRFIENHDEERASEWFGKNHAVAALVLLTSPGMTLIHQGQLEGLKKKIPVQLIRLAKEKGNNKLLPLYLKFFELRADLRFQKEACTEWLELNAADLSRCFGYCRSIPGSYAFVLANFSEHGIDIRFMHPALDGLDESSITAYSTRFPEPLQEWQLSDDCTGLHLRPHEGMLLMVNKQEA
ncbi:MAG TPA: alpha-amylase [Chlorobaculum parvum]|uniref:Alpha-amylase n=1 Tax=Chlorobaculum parvum TaxID=274539 RepID=A0A7C5DD64_9CHLB|nr:alpha-amylase [Chlorobaculum parvum]